MLLETHLRLKEAQEAIMVLYETLGPVKKSLQKKSLQLEMQLIITICF